jgi:hypothetical protein
MLSAAGEKGKVAMGDELWAMSYELIARGHRLSSFLPSGRLAVRPVSDSSSRGGDR